MKKEPQYWRSIKVKTVLKVYPSLLSLLARTSVSSVWQELMLTSTFKSSSCCSLLPGVCSYCPAHCLPRPTTYKRLLPFENSVATNTYHLILYLFIIHHSYWFLWTPKVSKPWCSCSLVSDNKRPSHNVSHHWLSYSSPQQPWDQNMLAGKKWECMKAPAFERDRLDPPNTGNGFQKFLSLHYEWSEHRQPMITFECRCTRRQRQVQEERQMPVACGILQGKFMKIAQPAMHRTPTLALLFYRNPPIQTPCPGESKRSQFGQKQQKNVRIVMVRIMGFQVQQKSILSPLHFFK